MAESALPPEPATGINQPSARIGNSGDSGWAGWAISSFTNKAAAAKGEIQPARNGTPAPPQSKTPLATPSASGRNTPASFLSPKIPPAKLSASLDGPKNPLVSTTPNDPVDSFEGWGEFDEEQFFDASTTVKPSSSPKLTATAVDDGGEPDFAGWLAAQSQGKAKKPLSKTAKTSTRPGLTSHPSSTSKPGDDNAVKNSTHSVPRATNVVPKKVEAPTPAVEKLDDGWDEDW